MKLFPGIEVQVGNNRRSADIKKNSECQPIRRSFPRPGWREISRYTVTVSLSNTVPLDRFQAVRTGAVLDRPGAENKGIWRTLGPLLGLSSCTGVQLPWCLIPPGIFSYSTLCDCVSPRISHCIFPSAADLQKEKGIGRYWAPSHRRGLKFPR